MKKILFLILLQFSLIANAQITNPKQADPNPAANNVGYRLVWSDEFNIDGAPNPLFWKYENGFVRNEELQWYQPNNVICKNGLLVFEAKKENVLNPNYIAGSSDWKQKRQYANYTSSSIKTQGLVQAQFGSIEVRARIDTRKGAWPAIWTLGAGGEWPSCGEVDIMEFYRKNDLPSLLANVAWGTATRWVAHWDGASKPLSYFTNLDGDWANKFHVWRMDWNKDSINLYLDDLKMNYTLLNQTINNPNYPPVNPFLQKHYFLLNLAIGSNGGDPSNTAFPITYEVDYIRIWNKIDPLDKNLVYNGDFSDYKMGWQVNNAFEVEESPIGNMNGSYCRLTGVNENRIMQQAIQVVPGKTYTFTFNARIQNSHTAGLQPNNNSTYGVATLKGKIETSDGQLLAEVSTKSNTTTKLEVSFTAPTTTSIINLIISKDWNVAYIDDISVTEDTNAALNNIDNSKFSLNYNKNTNSISVSANKLIKQIRVYNLQGKIIMDKALYYQNTEIVEFNSNTKGLYIVETIFSDNLNAVGKISIN